MAEKSREIGKYDLDLFGMTVEFTLCFASSGSLWLGPQAERLSMTAGEWAALELPDVARDASSAAEKASSRRTLNGKKPRSQGCVRAGPEATFG